MTLDIKVSAALMKYNFLEQNKIFHALETATVEKLTKYSRWFSVLELIHL